MTKLIRLAYTSRATFRTQISVEGIEPDVEKILVEARAKNRQARIGGVLYFADGYFFQCLEGDEQAVLNLVAALEKDSRHENLKVSFCKHVKRRQFKDWTMKYVPVNDAVITFMHEHGYTVFNPCEFEETNLNALIELFTRLEDTSLRSPHLRASHRFSLPWWKRLFRSPIQTSCV